MGLYATTTALQTIMIGTTFDSATTAFASKCIDWAEDEVDKFLAKRYDVSGSTFQTASSIPPLVRSLTEQIATGYMKTLNSRASKEAILSGEKLIKMAQDELTLLTQYKIHLLNTAGSSITESENTAYRIECNTSEYATTFNEDDETKWSVDSDKLEDISDERD